MEEYDYSELKDEWVELARKDMPALIEVLKDFKHDYNTSALATSVLAYAGFEYMAQELGITGNQAQWAALEFLALTRIYSPPFGIRSYNDMLYPQYEHKFNCISRDTFNHLQSEAKKHLEEDSVLQPHKDVIAHWKSIVDGNVPFGYKIEK